MNFSTLLKDTPKDSVSPPLACSLVTSLSVSSISLTKLYVLPNLVAGLSFLCHLSGVLLFAFRVLRENTDLPPPGRLMESVDSSLSFSSLLPNSLASAIGETNLPLVSLLSSDFAVSTTSSAVFESSSTASVDSFIISSVSAASSTVSVVSSTVSSAASSTFATASSAVSSTTSSAASPAATASSVVSSATSSTVSTVSSAVSSATSSAVSTVSSTTSSATSVTSSAGVLISSATGCDVPNMS